MTLAYTTGTITLTNNSATVTGIGTGWVTALITGGVIYPEADGNSLSIKTVNSNTSITADTKWKGATGTYAYAIVRDTAYLQQITANANALAAYLSELDSASLGALAAIAGSMASGKVPRALGSATMEWMTVSDAAKTLLDDGDIAAMRATLGGLFYKNGGVANDILAGAAADFNGIPGDGLWRLDRGGGLACLNGPPNALDGGLAYRCLQIGDSGRGTQIAMSYGSGMLYVRTGQDGWGGWFSLATGRNQVSLTAAGGDESDITTGDQIRLSLPFTATTSRVQAMATWAYSITASAAFEAVGTLRLWDNVTNAVADQRACVFTVAPGDTGLGFRGLSCAAISYGLLTPGRSYTLQLLMRKSAAIGPLLPRSMAIVGTLF